MKYLVNLNDLANKLKINLNDEKELRIYSSSQSYGYFESLDEDSNLPQISIQNKKLMINSGKNILYVAKILEKEEIIVNFNTDLSEKEINNIISIKSKNKKNEKIDWLNLITNVSLKQYLLNKNKNDLSNSIFNIKNFFRDNPSYEVSEQEMYYFNPLSDKNYIILNYINIEKYFNEMRFRNVSNNYVEFLKLKENNLLKEIEPKKIEEMEEKFKILFKEEINIKIKEEEKRKKVNSSIGMDWTERENISLFLNNNYEIFKEIEFNKIFNLNKNTIEKILKEENVGYYVDKLDLYSLYQFDYFKEILKDKNKVVNIFSQNKNITEMICNSLLYKQNSFFIKTKQLIMQNLDELIEKNPIFLYFKDKDYYMNEILSKEISMIKRFTKKNLTNINLENFKKFLKKYEDSYDIYMNNSDIIKNIENLDEDFLKNNTDIVLKILKNYSDTETCKKIHENKDLIKSLIENNPKLYNINLGFKNYNNEEMFYIYVKKMLDLNLKNEIQLPNFIKYNDDKLIRAIEIYNDFLDNKKYVKEDKLNEKEFLKKIIENPNINLQVSYLPKNMANILTSSVLNSDEIKNFFKSILLQATIKEKIKINKKDINKNKI